ncbi:hypothetical protein BJ508DRAFT_311376 [Ascobolus immersus RN42]|uniref:Uncharacterized protein n=1 Tax=Ascobolus immersus RN42 TaxID=1160509 RepID=A0A3N4HUG6_ASCIM|nr:hypothetical protein BJ508DRAFT_311376 [Ascobolus immersus RN42]
MRFYPATMGTAENVLLYGSQAMERSTSFDPLGVQSAASTPFTSHSVDTTDHNSDGESTKNSSFYSGTHTNGNGVNGGANGVSTVEMEDEREREATRKFAALHARAPRSFDPYLEAIYAEYMTCTTAHGYLNDLPSIELNTRLMIEELRIRIERHEKTHLPNCKEPGCPNFTYYWMVGKKMELEVTYNQVLRQLVDRGFVFKKGEIRHGTARGSMVGLVEQDSSVSSGDGSEV